MVQGIEISAQAEQLHREALVLDMVLPFVGDGRSGTQLLERFANSGHDYVSLTIAGDHNSADSAIKRLASVRALIRSNAAFVLVEKADDIASAKAAGKLGVGLQFEGTNCFERNLDLVSLFYDLGVRQCIPAFNLNNSVAGGCADRQDPGLSRFGMQVLEAMQAVGMTVDLSHTGYRSSMEAMEQSRAPVIFSHSNVASLADHYRNLRDDQIKACAATGGVIGLSGASIYLGEPTASTQALLDHIERLIELTGPEHVGLGTDYVADTEDLARYVLGNPIEWPDRLGLPERMPVYSPPEQRIELTELMIRRGYPEQAIRGILGENFLRVCRATWK